MKTTNCRLQDQSGQTGRNRFRPRHAAALGLAGMISTLFSGCGYFTNSNVSAVPTIRPIYITRNADSADGYYDLGKYYFWQNRFDKARESFQQAIKLRADHIDALNGLGAVYDRLGQFDSAQQSYRKALSLAPAAAHIWANLGYSLMLQGRPTTAVALLEKSLLLDPANTMVRQHLALATEAAAKLAASAAASGLALPVVGSTEPALAPAAAPAAVETKTQTALPAERAKPTVPGMITLVPREQITQSHMMTVSPTRPVPASDELRPTTGARLMASRTVPAAITAPPLQPVAMHATAASAPVAPDLGRARIEISNGNGVNGMARALSAAMKTEGANITRITNALPFDKPRTTIVCAENMKGVASAIAKRLPGNPLVSVGSTADRNVEIRVVLGADATHTWSNSSKVVLASLK